MGIKQLSYFVRFFGGLITIIIGVVRERRFEFLANVPKVFRILTLLKPTFTNFSNVWDEFRDLSDDEREELNSVLAVELDYNLEDPEQKFLISKGIDSCLSLLECIANFKR